ncbi:MAG TPA: cell division protein SepF [Candidatus Fimenecus excrementigallinarum]|uniref:Cell division protein SepF n=1 Tax=Candidatus Fimenecus excrementigallinarum TaxID=2840816 RepID=A0A9D1IF15_9FIRM|nr:cell division protein SepF [Candidatus Fimenecus excrementigallinarum]
MSFLDKVKNMVNVSEDDYYDELESDDFQQPAPEEPEEPRRTSRRARERDRDRDRDSGNNVVNIHTTARLQVVLAKPESFEEARAVADNLNEKHTVVLNLESANREVARRLVDFLSGVAYANGGQFKRVANSTFIITPYNVDVMGDLLDELENNGVFF